MRKRAAAFPWLLAGAVLVLSTAAHAETAAPHPAQRAGPKDLSSMLAAMRSTTGVVADFTETKEIALLSAPLESAGTIYFLPPRRFARVVTSPSRSRLVVDGDRVRIDE